MESRTADQLFGIHQLYCPTNEAAKIDIVAVHGLNEDAYDTWTTNDICWLNHPDLLPKYVPRARVLTWGYNANMSSIGGRTTSSHDIPQHAQTLVAQLLADRELEDATERPIIFICHSLGGIIVKSALTYSESRSSSKISHIHSIYTCTFGILFFGTPHRGTNKARLLNTVQKMVTSILPSFAIQTSSHLLKALEEDSGTLEEITDHFAPLMPRFRIVFFWEQVKMNLIYAKVFIVDETSAAPVLENTERCGIAADHREMCRFGNRDAPGFKAVVASLERWIDEAPEVILGRLSTSTAIFNVARQFAASELLGGKFKPLAMKSSSDSLGSHIYD